MQIVGGKEMKTNQMMVRKMGNFNVTQRTKDGYFDASSLLKQWNESTGMQKQMSHYTSSSSTNEFIKALVNEEELKERDSVLIQRRGKNGGTYMHPLLFLDFAMWINPSFKVKVLKFVYDEMIRYRNEAGDAYKELGCAVMKIVPKASMKKAMKKVAEALNWIVFDGHEKMMRNKQGDEEKQRELFQLEHKVSDLINEGFITRYDDLVNYLRRLYHKKNSPSVFHT